MIIHIILWDNLTDNSYLSWDNGMSFKKPLHEEYENGEHKKMIKYWNFVLKDHGTYSERNRFTITNIFEKVGGLVMMLASILEFLFSIYNYRLHDIKVLEEYEYYEE